MCQHEQHRKGCHEDHGWQDYSSLCPAAPFAARQEEQCAVDEEGECREQVDLDFRTDAGEHDEGRPGDDEEELLQVGLHPASAQGREENAYDKERPRRKGVPHGAEIVVERVLMVERADRAVHGLVEKQVVQIGCASFEEDRAKPKHTASQQYAPCAPSPIAPERAQVTFRDEEHGRAEQRHEDAHRSFAEKRHEHIEGKQPPVSSGMDAVSAPEAVECVERQHDEHAHEHVHAQVEHQAQEQAAGEHHPSSGGAQAFVGFESGPAVHDIDGHESRQEGEERQQPHRVSARQPLGQHQQPEIERRLVGIRLPVKGEGEECAVAQGFVDDAQVA